MERKTDVEDESSIILNQASKLCSEILDCYLEALQTISSKEAYDKNFTDDLDEVLLKFQQKKELIMKQLMIHGENRKSCHTINELSKDTCTVMLDDEEF